MKQRTSIIVYLCIYSFSTKLENAPKVVKERKDGPSVSLPYEDQPQPQPKVNVILVKEKLPIILTAYTMYMYLSCNFYPLIIFKLGVFLTERDNAHTQEPN